MLHYRGRLVDQHRERLLRKNFKLKLQKKNKIGVAHFEIFKTETGFSYFSKKKKIFFLKLVNYKF